VVQLSGQGKSAAAVPKARRWSHVAAILVLGFVLSGVAILIMRGYAARPSSASGFAAVRTLRPFTIVSKQDIQSVTLPASAMPRDAVTRREDIVGHYLLTQSPAGRPIGAGAVGSKAPAGLDQAFVIGLTGDASVSLDGRLVASDIVDVLFPGQTGSSPEAIRSARVLSVRNIRPALWAVVLALPSAPNEQQASGLAKGGTALLRQPSGTG